MESKYDSKKLKEYEVKVLDKFVSVCDEHKLDYYLAYGTLLGAVRHKGFIPWDDDIDVYMKPKDYYEFKKIMLDKKLDGFFYQSFETEKYYCLPFAKLRMDNTSVVEEKLKDEDIHNGIYIDIFPLVPYPKDEKDRKKMFSNLKVINLFIEADLKNNPKYDYYGKVGKIISKTLKLIPRNLRNKVVIKIFKNILFYEKEYDKYICLFENKTFEKSYFDECEKLLFEKNKYSVPKEYDKYLTDIYGDYMTPPPVDKRQGHSFVSVGFEK